MCCSYLLLLLIARVFIFKYVFQKININLIAGVPLPNGAAQAGDGAARKESTGDVQYVEEGRHGQSVS